MGGYHTGAVQQMNQTLPQNKPDAGRRIYLDYLRVIATVSVIGVHTVSLASSLSNRGSLSFYVLEIFDFAFLSSNLLFILISGALLLPVREERITVFFQKRIRKVVVPLTVYYILYVVAKEGAMWLQPKYWRVLFLRILSGPPEEAPHFWIIYTLLGLYVLTPLLRWIVAHIPQEVLAGVIGIVFFVNALQTYAPAFGIPMPLSVIVDSFAGVFLFGYFLSGNLGRRVENFFIAGGALSFLFSCILIFCTESYPDYIYQNAPTMMLFSASVFLLVKRGAQKCVSEHFLIRFICKYSFSVLLIHWGVLHYAVKQLLHIDVLSGGIVGGCLLTAALTFVLSLAGAIVIDHTLVWTVNKILDRVNQIIDRVKQCVRYFLK